MRSNELPSAAPFHAYGRDLDGKGTGRLSPKSHGCPVVQHGGVSVIDAHPYIPNFARRKLQLTDSRYPLLLRENAPVILCQGVILSVEAFECGPVVPQLSFSQLGEQFADFVFGLAVWNFSRLSGKETHYAGSCQNQHFEYCFCSHGARANN